MIWQMMLVFVCGICVGSIASKMWVDRLFAICYATAPNETEALLENLLSILYRAKDGIDNGGN